MCMTTHFICEFILLFMIYHQYHAGSSQLPTPFPGPLPLFTFPCTQDLSMLAVEHISVAAHRVQKMVTTWRTWWTGEDDSCCLSHSILLLDVLCLAFESHLEAVPHPHAHDYWSNPTRITSFAYFCPSKSNVKMNDFSKFSISNPGDHEQLELIFLSHSSTLVKNLYTFRLSPENSCYLRRLCMAVSTYSTYHITSAAWYDAKFKIINCISGQFIQVPITGNLNFFLSNPFQLVRLGVTNLLNIKELNVLPEN